MRCSLPPSRPVLVALAVLAAGLGGVTATAQSPRPANAPAAVDPVAAAVAEASRRFGVPEAWIRAVMRVESAGRADAVSRAGAIGLMQVMPATYAELRARHGLGPDPFAVRDNVLAGTAYLREMFDRYGATGMLAAYNAGPGRWEAHLAGNRPLPAETVGYLARLAPMLDIATVPASSTRMAVTPPSPFQAPIFVALSGGSAAASVASDEPVSRTLVAVNTTAIPTGGELFVPRTATVRSALSSDEPNVDSVRPTPPSGVSTPVGNPLFPARSGREERR